MPIESIINHIHEPNSFIYYYKVYKNTSDLHGKLSYGTWNCSPHVSEVPFLYNTITHPNVLCLSFPGLRGFE